MFSVEYQKAVNRWQPPDWRFVEFDAADEGWLRKLGLGREVTTYETTKVPYCTLRSVRIDREGNRLVQHLVIDAINPLEELR